MLVFLPGQDDIEALQSLLEENLPDIIGQQSSGFLAIHGDKKNGDVIEGKAENVVEKGILKDFEIRPLYAAMPPEEQVCMLKDRNVILHIGLPCMRYGAGSKVIDSVTHTVQEMFFNVTVCSSCIIFNCLHV